MTQSSLFEHVQNLATQAPFVQQLRPTIGERLACHAAVLNAGRSITVVEASVSAWQGQNTKFVSKAIITIANVTLTQNSSADTSISEN